MSTANQSWVGLGWVVLIWSWQSAINSNSYMSTQYSVLVICVCIMTQVYVCYTLQLLQYVIIDRQMCIYIYTYIHVHTYTDIHAHARTRIYIYHKELLLTSSRQSPSQVLTSEKEPSTNQKYSSIPYHIIPYHIIPCH